MLTTAEAKKLETAARIIVEVLCKAEVEREDYGQILPFKIEKGGRAATKENAEARTEYEGRIVSFNSSAEGSQTQQPRGKPQKK